MIMKYIFKKTLFFLLILMCTFPVVAGEKSDTLTNEFIKIIVNKGPQDQGRFSIETTNGDPLSLSDDNQLLIYGRPTPWTSYTTIKIDGKNYIFGGPSKKTQRRTGKLTTFGEVVSQEKNAESLSTVVKFDKISVTQTLQFFRSPTTRVKDAVLISYDIQNLDSTKHDIGLRLMLDTKLGSNDGAPFRIGESEITSELELDKERLADYWMTFDSLSTPNIIAQGTLKLGDLQIYPPDKLLLSNWGTLVDNPWEIDYKEGRSFIRTGENEKDTALGLYWNPQSVEPSKNLSIKTLYGLGEITLAPGELSLGLTAPKEIPINSTEEHLIMAYIFNSGGFDAHQSQLEFDLPKGLSITQGKLNTTHSILKTGETLQIPIKVKLNDAIEPGLFNIGFRAQSTTLESNSIERNILFSAPPKLSYKISTKLIKTSPVENYYLTTLTLSNYSHLPIKRIAASLRLPKQLALVSLEEKIKKVPLLESNKQEKLTWLIKTPVESLPTQSIRVLIKSNSNKVLISKLKQHLPTQRLSLSESKESIEKGDYFYISINQKQADPLNLENLEIHLDKKLRFIRYSVNPEITNTPNVTYKNSVISIDNLKSKTLPFQNSLLKLHFKALEKGQSNIILKINNKQSLEKEITIKEKTNVKSTN
ncbi:hypothetical protein DID80_03165 [Candidatus Marinamargulisbacteria bacterium SCGC AAA071-K20]|nr:hypothetical protein DID80_03165 [Candidatus Marinamargulisbacteria bacterium SCGC AAA071-K20]